ncbi:MAG: polyphenol oxidase family protein [Candidatus Paceibacterota bacterium]|jgi:copper oxidase (laccase) domain-containing protein
MLTEIFLPSESVPSGVIIPNLSHGSNIVTIQSGDENVDDCDALITENHSLSLGIRTADCAPICFSDGKKIGIVHVGWRGLCLGLIEKMLTNFNTTTLSIYVAPFLHSFEIQRDVCYDRILQKFGERYIEQRSGKLVFHFKNAIGSLLPAHAVYDARSTETDRSFPSHRRDKTKERFVTVVSFPL